MQYSEQIAHYFSLPARIPGDQLRGEAGSREQGAWIVFGADVRAGNLVNVGFRAFACPHIIAACHKVAEELEGGPMVNLTTLQPEILVQDLHIPVEKAGKLLILKDALLACGEAAPRT